MTTRWNLVTASLILMTIGCAMSQDCPEDYSPCSCYLDGAGGLQITCSVAMSDVQDVFNRTATPSVYALRLQVPSSDDVVPANLLAGKRVEFIELSCTSNRESLAVNAEAFSSTRQFTDRVAIYNCDLGQLDYSFLNGFANLTWLDFSSSNNIHKGGFGSLPPLPSLSTLYIRSVAGFNESTINFPILTNGLAALYFMNNYDVDDQSMSRTLDWILESSVDTLLGMTIESNRLSHVPKQVSRFSKLNRLRVNSNYIPLITTNAFNFASPVEYLDIISCSVNTIDPQAFVGNFTRAYVSLFANDLTRFEASVFQSMLEQMALSTGSLDIVANRFDCANDPCHLAWLIRDNRHLMPLVRTASCSNFTYFSDLDPAAFNDCPSMLQ